MMMIIIIWWWSSNRGNDHHNVRICSRRREGGEAAAQQRRAQRKTIIIIIIMMIIFVIELDLWDSKYVFLSKCHNISKWQNFVTKGRKWLLKKAKSIRIRFQTWWSHYLTVKGNWQAWWWWNRVGFYCPHCWQDWTYNVDVFGEIGQSALWFCIVIIIIIIRMIIFVIHMYLWGIGTVFLSRYPRICNLTNVELGGGNWVLAEANCSTSSSRWSYFQFTCICEILTLYFSANAFVFQNGISLDSEVKFDFWKRQNAENHHPDDHVSNSHVFVRSWRCISLDISPYF